MTGIESPGWLLLIEVTRKLNFPLPLSPFDIPSVFVLGGKGID
jgi:hypothetical protein